MILEPIKNEKVLSPQYKQTVLPPIYADTSNIQKSISEQYGKTVVLPEKHSVEVKNFIETPQGFILQSSNIDSQPNIIANINSQSNNIQYANHNSQIYRHPVTGYDPGKVDPTI